jgi:two-component system, OmpR family, phosphate regulon response regulator PhoB
MQMNPNTLMPDPVRILLIDDSSTNNLLFKSIFEETGYQVMVEEDPLNAMESLNAIKPDLVLLDLMLPGMDGLELLQQIKSDQFSRDIPVIMYTAHHSVKAQKQAIALGAAGYLLKPVSPGEILEKVSRILS